MIFDFTGETNFRFDQLKQTVDEIIGFVNLPPEKMSLKTASLVSVYQSEENRWQKQKREEDARDQK